jgi:hypothetical protein
MLLSISREQRNSRKDTIMHKWLLLVAFAVILGCSTREPEILIGYGSIPYESIIGKEYYSDGNLAAYISADINTLFTHTIEKWHFYADSIVVIATHYSRYTKQALDQFKYHAIINGEMDKVWTDSRTDTTWRTTETIWKSYCRSTWDLCSWTDIFSFTSPPINIIIDYAPAPNTCIGLGSYESQKYFALLDTFPPIDIWYPEGWIGTLCHTVP